MAPIIEAQSQAGQTTPTRVSSPEPFPWTVGDEFDDEVPEPRKRRAARFRKRQIQAETHSPFVEVVPTEAPAYPPPDFIPPSPGSPDGDTSGDDDSGIDSDSEDEDPGRHDRPDFDGPSPTGPPPSESFPGFAFPEPTKDLALDSDSDSDDDDEAVTSHLSTDAGNPATPTETDWVNGPSSSTTSSIGERATAEAARQAEQKHHEDVEKALTAVGSIAGAVLVAALVWFLWRCMKRRKARKNGDSAIRPLFLNGGLGNTGWTTVEAPPLHADEKKPSDESLLGILPEEPKRASLRPLVLPTRVQNESRQPPPPPLDLSPGSNPNPTYDSAQTYPSRTFGTYDTRYSFGSSSLSSAFGNGTFMLPTPSREHHDSVYAQSERSLPRFRTIDSWVGQQTGRVRSKVPEQGFGLMMPDDEKARRVVAPNGVGFG